MNVVVYVFEKKYFLKTNIMFFNKNHRYNGVSKCREIIRAKEFYFETSNENEYSVKFDVLLTCKLNFFCY